MDNLIPDGQDSPETNGTAAPAASQPTTGGTPRRPKRPGPGNPGKRCTVEEHTEHIVGTAKLIAKRLHKYEIKRFLKSKYDLGSRQAEEYIAKGRAWLLAQANRPREDFVAEAITFYESIIRDPEVDLRHKEDAQLALREMLGLDMPFKIAPTTPDGGSPYVPKKVLAEMSDDELAVLRRLHLRIQQYRRIESGEAVAADDSSTVVDAASVKPVVNEQSAD